MTTRFTVKNRKGFYLRREAKNNSGCTGWAMEKELALEYDSMEEANHVIDQMEGSSALYTVELLTGVAGSEVIDAKVVQNFSFRWQHKEGLYISIVVDNLTEMEMIDRIFEEARQNGLPIMKAKVEVLPKRENISEGHWKSL